jgi:uncharacterized protein (TIGR00255 family)
MILSMTGYGCVEQSEAGVSFRVEVRSLNGRYYKASLKLPERFSRFEIEIDKVIRTRLGRGSISYQLRVRDPSESGHCRINSDVLTGYVRQLQQAAEAQPAVRVDLASLLELPGVCEEAEEDEAMVARQFEVVRHLTALAIDRLMEMRQEEGQALREDMEACCKELRRRVAEVERRRGPSIEEYQSRLTARIEQLLRGLNTPVEPGDLSREVALFAERCDVSEELARINSHLDQFTALCASPEPAGRRLDFLAQELLREANTIGSKANDAAIAREVVEMKAVIDRIKEQVQNVE